MRWEVGASLKRQAGGERRKVREREKVREVNKDEEDRVGEKREKLGALTQRIRRGACLPL